MDRQEVKIKTEFITLSSFLKWANVVASGGEAKALINEGLVRVNGRTEYKKGKKLYPQDIVVIDSIIELIVRK